jgi:hypothetical protein
VADACELGLSSKAETEEINGKWVRSVFNGTGIDYLFTFLARSFAAARLSMESASVTLPSVRDD